jgi:thiosulfate reductase cytochrome b subunit
MFRQVKYYLISIFNGEENPFRPSAEGKFNPLQRLAHGSVMGIFAPVLIITGLLFSDISFLRKYVLLWDLAKIVNAVHVAGAYVFVLYLVIHIYMATMGRTIFSHVKAMIVGYGEEGEAIAGNAQNAVKEVPQAEASAGSGSPNV